MEPLSVRLTETSAGDPLARDDVLAVIGGDGPHADADPRCLPLPLAVLSSAWGREIWQVDGRVESGLSGRLNWARSEDHLWVHRSVSVPSGESLATAADSAYAELLDWIGGQAQRHWLRVWNVMGDINAGDGDAERYRQFVAGRHAAFTRAGLTAAAFPAATAVGGDGPQLVVAVLAGREPGLHLENPRQLSAYRYPRSYGPRSPSFARATRSGELLLISGTGSVRGHASRHDGDVLAQLDEVLANLDAVQAEAGGDWEPQAVKAFLRETGDVAAVQDRLRERLPVPVMFLQGDLCRRELLLELEGVYRRRPAATARAGEPPR